MRAYISGPMTGRPHYETEFDAAETYLRECGFAVINPAKLTAILPENETSYNEYLRIDLQLVEMCDIVFALDGWENSTGARAEIQHAKDLCMPVFCQRDFMGGEEATA